MPSSPQFIVADVARSQAFYLDVFGATVLREGDASLGEPAFLRLGNIWLLINVGGGPTDDKPEVIATPPQHPNELSGFMNLRVTDIARFYDCGVPAVQVGQTTVTPSPLDLYS
ncbi:MAG TPA: hypothetical protein VNW46_16130 [Gemmatimonadaceae bacterium]|nr:hypothetical protein [Gemmatimonadaceae bacterium]